MENVELHVSVCFHTFDHFYRLSSYFDPRGALYLCCCFYYFPFSCGLNRVAIRPALGRTVRFFKALSGVRRSIKPDAYLSSF